MILKFRPARSSPVYWASVVGILLVLSALWQVAHLGSKVQGTPGIFFNASSLEELMDRIPLQSSFTCLNRTSRDCAQRIWVKKYRFYMYVYPAEKDIVSFNVIQNKKWEGHGLKEILSVLRQPVNGTADEDPLFVDIGANVGWFTLGVASQGYRVMAFEGMQQNVELMLASLCANPSFQHLAKLHQLGLGREDAKCLLFAGGDNVGDGHMSCGDDEAMRFTDAGYQQRGTMLVTRLDNVLDEDVKVLKMDVEGAEWLVLQGASKLVKERGIPYITLEYAREMLTSVSGPGSPQQLSSFLSSAGYQCSLTGFKGQALSLEALASGRGLADVVNLYCHQT